MVSKRIFTILALTLVTIACDEATLLENKATIGLNAPIDTVEIPGSDIALVLNANINLNETDGSLLPVQISTGKLLPEDGIRIPSLAGKVWVEPSLTKIFISSRARDALLVYDYSTPGPNGEAISFKSTPVENPAEETTNGIRTDEEPFDILKITTSAYGDVLLVVNSVSGSLTVIRLDTLKPVDFIPSDDELNGIPLFSASSIQRKDDHPARSASRIVLNPGGNLVYITLLNLPHIYVVDIKNLRVEAMLDYSAILGTSGGFRDTAFDASGRLLSLYPRTGQLIVTDVSDITDNGIDQEVVAPKVDQMISVGRSPEGLAFSDNGEDVFITLLKDNEVVVVNLPRNKITDTIPLAGVGPGEIFKLSTANVAWINQFASDSLSVLDLSTKAVTGSIK